MYAAVLLIHRVRYLPVVISSRPIAEYVPLVDRFHNLGLARREVSCPFPPAPPPRAAPHLPLPFPLATEQMAARRCLTAALVVGLARALLRSSHPALLHPPSLALRSVIAQQPNVQTRTERPARELHSRLNVRIDDEWYDLTNWRVAHPAGTHWIDAYNNSDATEVMYAFHSERAMEMFKRLPKSKAPPALRPPTPASYAFRQFRQRLVEEGWFKPSVWGETKKLLPWATTLGAGLSLAMRPQRTFTQGVLAVLLLAISNSLAGWLAHDYVHGRSRFCSIMRGFGEIAGGMSTTWWSNKHNMHHALTNEVGYDEDIALEPFLHLWQPDPKNDVQWLRKWQHVYWPLPYSTLFWYWRLDSIRYVIKHKKWNEAARLAVHWATFAALVPFHLIFFSVWLSGLITATIVTVTHQSEEIFYGHNLRKFDFVEAQFRSTRDAKCNNPISHILWGGMQWQLEHHLFPTMPRYRYPALSKEIIKFAEEQKALGQGEGLDYRVTGEFKIIADNVALLKQLAEADPVPGNPNAEPMFKQV